MPADKNLLDDIAKVAGGAVSLISTVRRQVKSDVRGRMDSYANRLDLAPREEVERLQAQVAMFRSEQDAMKKRITELEALVAGKKPAAKAASASRSGSAPGSSWAKDSPAASPPMSSTTSPQGSITRLWP